MTNYDDRLGDYNDVPARIAEFRTKHPEGSLQPANPDKPFELVEVGGKTYVAYVAAAYRTPDDPRPGIGTAWEQWPGRTPYTRDSELQNAETSAWGRAIVAALAADTKKGVASREEVRNRKADREPVSWDPAEQEVLVTGWTAEINDAGSVDEIRAIGKRLLTAKRSQELSPASYDHLVVLGGRRKAELDEQAGVPA